MKRSSHDQAADDRLERLLDEELRAVAQPAPVNLRAKVLEALAPPGVAQTSRFAIARLPRYQLGLAAAVVILAAGGLLFWRGTILLEPGSSRVSQQAVRRALPGAPLAAGASLTPVAGDARMEPATASTLRAAGRSQVRSRETWAEPMPADLSLASAEPYLPGAPAGELGDPLLPMPSPPAISFAPIASAPSVSETARPVTDFPADNPAPDVPVGTKGQSGGTRR